MQEQLLPLFPLGVVLFPRTPLPLHIFEDRYKEMFSDVMPGQGEFGVVLAQDKGILNMGCTATVEKVIKKYPDGKLDLFTIGRRRFEIQELNEDKSYLRARVEFFDDDDFQPVPKEVKEQALAAYKLLISIQPPEQYQKPEMNDPQLSFQIAQLVPDVDFRQVMLRTRSEVDRMKQLVRFMPPYLARLRYSERVRQAAPHNGHGRLQE